ncbi:MAG: DUF1826 domain-containing protein [Gammaproteobacteria bacterium]
MALATVLTPGINLSLWRPRSLASVVNEVADLTASTFPNVRCLTSTDTCAADIDALFRQQGLMCAGFLRWIDDLIQLTEIFSGLVGARPITLRLETTDQDSCPRFHVDRTYLRLLCVYRGPGTEWLENKQVNRYALQHGAPNAAIVRYGAPSRFRPFWVGVMKGDRFPGNEGNGSSASFAADGRP